jgi:hypothetical protein
MLALERKRALSPDWRARTTAATLTPAARSGSGQGTAREVGSSYTWLANFATRQECEERDLRTRSMRRTSGWELGGYGGLQRTGEVGFEKCGPYRGLLPRATAWEGEWRGGGASTSLDELQPWRLRSSAVVSSEMARRQLLERWLWLRARKELLLRVSEDRME